MSLNGKIPIMVHQRLDFLLAMDQLVNNASSGILCLCKNRVPITIRLIIGRGWGRAHIVKPVIWFAHVPGSSSSLIFFLNNEKLNIDSILDPEPVIIIEHRWTHNIEEN